MRTSLVLLFNMKKQQYLVTYPSSSTMGASTSFDFCEEKDLPNFGLYAEYLSVYPVGKELSDKQKLDFGMQFMPKR